MAVADKGSLARDALALPTPASPEPLGNVSMGSAGSDTQVKRRVSMNLLSEDEASPTAETPMVRRQPLQRNRSISFTSIANKAFVNTVGSMEAEMPQPQAFVNTVGSMEAEMPQPQEEQDGAGGGPKPLWSGRSFGSVADFPFGAAFEPPTPKAFIQAAREASFASQSLVTPKNSRMTLVTPKNSRMSCLPLPVSPAAPRGSFGMAADDLCDDSDQNDGRFVREFSEAGRIGEGHFAAVFKARHNVDRCLYAVKRTKLTVKGRQMRQVQEAFVLASMALETEACPNIVRYFSSWFEGSQLFIQMELCQGSLRDHLALLCDMRSEDPRFRKSEILELLSCVAGGLHSMHSCGFAHLDIKPDNIMRGRGSGRWKIGDFGLAVAAMGIGCDDVCEGDCRYLAREILQGNLDSLESGDVFSLGIMAFELATNPEPLPCTGDEWQAVRDGRLDTSVLQHLSSDLVEHLVSLVRPVALQRPNCEDILDFCDSRADTGRDGRESEEVKRLQKEIEELSRTAQESQRLADRYSEELALLRQRTASDNWRGKADFCGEVQRPQARELTRSYSM